MKLVANCCDWDGRIHDVVGVTTSVGGAVPLMPAPVSGMTIVPVEELLPIVKFALYVATAGGSNVTKTLQLAPPASVPPPCPLPQLVVNGNAGAVLMLVKVIAAAC